MDPADVPFSLLYLIDGMGLRAELVGVSGVELDDLAFRRDIVIADVDALASTREGRAALAELFRRTPVPIAVLRGPDLAYDLANPAYLQVFGGRDIVGKPLLEALPELHGQGVDQLLQGVMQTGVAHVGHETLLKLNRQGTGAVEDTYWTFIYAPLQDDNGQVEGSLRSATSVHEMSSDSKWYEKAVSGCKGPSVYG